MIEAGGVPVTQGRLNYGMVGGGRGSFIGDVHRKALAFDGLTQLKAGCFSRDFANTRETGFALGLDNERLYPTPQDMVKAEAARADRLDFVVIVTPNADHYPVAKAFLAAGIPVVCDKPLTLEPWQAEELATLAKAKNLLFCVTYTYTGFPAVKQAKAMVAAGLLGDLRFVNAEYAQEWLASPLETTGQKQAVWRTDPKLAGKSNCVGDIGSHIEHMVWYITGLKIERLCARLDSFGEGRTLDDNASILVDYVGGAKGMYWSSQIAIGHDNGLRLRIYGSLGALEWFVENPNTLIFRPLGKPVETWSRGRDGFAPHAQAYSRIPSGHAEGYYEAFANLYSTFCRALSAVKAGRRPAADDLDFPTLADGLEGVRFIDKCVESSHGGSAWVSLT